MLPGNTYHLFNHANGNENLFEEEKNYTFFLNGITKYLFPICHIYAYCLMPNHFHILGEIKTEEELIEYFANKIQVTQKMNKIVSMPGIKDFSYGQLIQKISKSFSNLFNSYAQSFNRIYDRKGSLFMQNMKKQEIKDDDSFCNVVHYIHANPVHHQFVRRMEDWPHSSYRTFLSKSQTKIDRDYVLDMFGGIDCFMEYHQQPICPKIAFLE